MRQRLRDVAVALLLTAAACVPLGQSSPAQSPTSAAEPTARPSDAAHSGSGTPSESGSATQIDWQRSLADARALAAATGKPLLLAVNMDGESASDRIVHENYRDPRFVAATRDCVCLVASVFRHAPRDYDDAGRRILCPRLGNVTCGEHIALEQQLWDAHLSDGERVAPRHALVAPDRVKFWDFSLAFDLGDITRELLDALAAPRATAVPSPGAAAPDAATRARAEAQLARLARGDVAGHCAALDAIAADGDAGSIAALRLLLADLTEQPAEVVDRFVAVTRACGLAAEVTAALTEQLRAGITAPPTLGPDDVDRLLPVIAMLDGNSPQTRSLLLACRAIAEYGDGSRRALELAFGTDDAATIEAALADAQGPLMLQTLLAEADAVTRAAEPGRLPSGTAIQEDLPPTEELEALLLELDGALANATATPQQRFRHGKASLDLARARLAAGDSGVQLLFEDAARQLRLAVEAEPAHTEWWIACARVAYFLQQFDAQVEAGRRAFATATGSTTRTAAWAEIHEPLALEALRWIGDGHARLLEARSGGAPAAELQGIVEGLRALGTVASRAEADATDWLSFASFCGALGLWREQLSIAHTGCRRLPADNPLRDAVSSTLWSLGRIDLAAAFAADVVRWNHESADARWFLGYAEILVAENARRSAQTRAADVAYERAALAFADARDLNPSYAQNCRYYLAMTWLGRGMAAVQTGDRQSAASSLVRAIEASSDIQTARDGLGADVFDLIDKIVEWRADGPSAVDVEVWVAAIERAAPGEAFWPVAIADALLREALRADGRNPVRELRMTVDAGGDPIEMMMGGPTESGDLYLAASLACVRRASPHVTTESDRLVCAQSWVVFAERELERGRYAGVADALREAASLLDETPSVAADSSADELRAFAARLRARLGPARPRLREGR